MSTPVKSSGGIASFFSVPAPIRTLFNTFPLVTLPAEPLPARSPRPSDVPTLHIFASSADGPSHNPTCLKWQAYLKLKGVEFRPVPSSNHASPTGSLPFLVAGREVVSAGKLEDWVTKRGAAEKFSEEQEQEVEEWLALIETKIRDAWLYALYLEPSNSKLLHQLYSPTSVSLFNYTLLREYRAAAETELRKSHPGVLSAEEIYADAETAWEALEVRLGEMGGEWYGGKKPGVLDAAVFGYVYLVENLPWAGGRGGRLRRGLERFDGLRGHAKRIEEACWGRK